MKSANAQLLVQNLWCKKLNVALHLKEGKRKEKSKTKLFKDGKGRVMMNASTVKELETQEPRNEQKRRRRSESASRGP